MSDKSHILVIDDEKNYLLVLQTLLEDEGYTVTAISDPETALAFLAESEVDVVVTDMKMPKVSGREVLQHVKKSWPYIPVLIMTAFGSIESAVEAMKYGAFDYITKPFSNDELLLSIHNATELARAHRQYRLLQEAMEERYSVHQIVGRSRAIRDVLVMLVPGGRACILEFAPVSTPLFGSFYHWYLRRIMPKLAGLVSHSTSAYDYFAETIENFPKPDDFSNELREAGFAFVQHIPFTLGVANLHIAVRG